MSETSIENLYRRILFIERSLAISDENYLKNKNQYDLVISKIRQMVEEGKFKTYLEIDSAFHFLNEKVKDGNKEIDRLADEIKDFIA